MDWLRRKDAAWAALYIAVTAIVAAVIASPVADRKSALEPGQVAVTNHVSRVAFDVVDEAATELDRRERLRTVAPQFAANRVQYDRLQLDIAALPMIARDAATFGDVPEATRQSLGLTQASFDELTKFFGADEGVVTAPWRQLTRELMRKLYDTPLVSPQDIERISDENPSHTILAEITHPDPRADERALRLKRGWAIIDVTDSEKVKTELAALVANYPVAVRDLILGLLQRNLEPTYTYDAEKTQIARRTIAQAVPARVEHVEAGQVLVVVGDQLTVDQVAAVQTEHEAFLSARGPWTFWMPRLGLLGLTLLITLGIWAYFFAYCPRLVRNPMRGGAITLLLLLCLAASVFTSALWPEFTIGALTFPVIFAAVVLAIAYDQRFALALGGALSLLVVMSLRLPLEFALIVMAGVGVAVMQLREIRNRSKLVIVGIYAGLAMAAAAAIVGVATRPVQLPGIPWLIFVDAASAFFAGFFTGLLVQGILPLIERAFNVTTAMTLRELNDASHPLLKRVAQEAPGTYQHSLRIADMAEAAADAIGADGLLCRVGAMFHDIGKTNKPMYFIENQGGGPNKHANLSPAMSLLIIVGHVKDGVEMAREFGLPPVIRHFVESHHGTTLVEYFYHEAKKQTQEQDQPTPSEFEFRYPGPKPKTREAAIMMICDAVEGAARAMDEPNTSRLETLVKNMANKRLMDGQFDDCDMTLQDLSCIEKAIIKSLCAMYHSRIKYPDDEKTQIIDMDAVHTRRSTAG